MMEQVVQQRSMQVRSELRRLVIPIFIETLLIMMLGAMDTIMLVRFSGV